MKLCNLPAAFCGISSSLSSLNHHWQPSHFRIRRPAAFVAESRISSSGFQIEPMATNNILDYHDNCCRFSCRSEPENRIFYRQNRLRQRRKYFHSPNPQISNHIHHFGSRYTVAFSTSSFDRDSIAESPAKAVNDKDVSHQPPSFRVFYNDVYEVTLPPRHRFPMGKYRKVRERVQDLISKLPQDQQQSVNCDFQVSPLATFDELSTTHDTTYIQRFLKGDQTEREQRNVGFPWSKEGVDRALSSVGGTLAAACFVCEQQRQRIKTEEKSEERATPSAPFWAAHIAGGTHHAFHDYGEGFSVFSDMAVAANVVLDRYPDVIKNNILMIDLDVHQGNGNAVLFQRGDSTDETALHKKHADRVFTFSMHCSGNYFSPKQESDLDIELPIGCQDQAYLMTLNHWLKRFRLEHNGEGSKHKLDLIIFQAGVDVLEADRLGRMDLSPEAVTRRNELVYEFAHDLKLPLVICMGGGYPKREDAWKPIIDAHADVYFGAHQFLSRLSQP